MNSRVVFLGKFEFTTWIFATGFEESTLAAARAAASAWRKLQLGDISYIKTIFKDLCCVQVDYLLGVQRGVRSRRCNRRCYWSKDVPRTLERLCLHLLPHELLLPEVEFICDAIVIVLKWNTRLKQFLHCACQGYLTMDSLGRMRSTTNFHQIRPVVFHVHMNFSSLGLLHQFCGDGSTHHRGLMGENSNRPRVLRFLFSTPTMNSLLAGSLYSLSSPPSIEKPSLHLLTLLSTHQLRLMSDVKKQALHFKDKVSFLWLCLSSPWYSHLRSEAYEKF